MMRFSVASWHLHHNDPDWWIEHNGYTTMCSPPAWARKANRNLSLFAPPSHIVFGGVPEEEYKRIYRNIMRSRHSQVLDWIATHDDEYVILLCACPDGQFCHRHLIAALLRWLDCEEVPLPGEETQEGSMKAITITNPWGVLVQQGVKKIETRSWGTSYRGLVAIHTSKKYTRDDKLTCTRQPFRADLVAAGFHDARDLPCGMVIATAQLVECIKMTWDFIDALDEKERCYGLYDEGRYAWKLEDVQPITPVSAHGQLGLWNWTPLVELALEGVGNHAN